MTVDSLLTALVLLAGFLAVFLIGRLVHMLLHRDYDVNHELTQQDNPALALALAGHYAGLILGVGGVMAGPATNLTASLIDLAIYGPMAIVLLNLSWYFCDFVILRRFKISDELIRDQNQGTGAVSAGVSLATGFILFGALNGEGGGIITALVFWALGQAMLWLAATMYNWITPYDVHAEVEKDNVAAGVGFGGALAGMGAIIGLAGQIDFESWSDSLTEYILFALVGLVLLPLVRFLTDKILLPGVNLSDEIANQAKPNLGAAYLEAFAYVAAAFMVYWCA